MLDYADRLRKILDDDAVIIVDDIYLTAEMRDAWNRLKQLPWVKATFDVLQMGIIFLNSGITPQNRVVRY